MINEEYTFLKQVLVRVPLYTVDDYQLHAIDNWIRRQDFLNALWLASPDFYRSLSSKSFDWQLLTSAEKATLRKYYNRMCFRATPFGAFAGFLMSEWGDRDQLKIAGVSQSILHLLPSSEWGRAIAVSLREHAEDYQLRLNPTLFRLGRDYSFVRSSFDENGRSSFSVASIPGEPLNDRIVELTGKAAADASELIRSIVDWTGCNLKEGEDYLKFLIDTEFLLTEHHPAVIVGERFFDEARQQPAVSIPFSADLDLREATAGLSRFSGIEQSGPLPLSDRITYAGMERILLDGLLSADWQQEICAALDLLRKIIIPFPTPALEKFKQAFEERFENRKVPLLEALDPDIGIGYADLYASPQDPHLLKDIVFPATEASRASREWSDVHRFFFQKWHGNLSRSQFAPLVITASEAQQLAVQTPGMPMPPSLSVLFSKIPGKIVLDNNGGATATALIGRFNVFTDQIRDWCNEISSAETSTNPDVIFAELHQLSDVHTDNINMRRPVYDYQIPINVYPEHHDQHVLMPGDLALSLVNGELILESLSEKKRVVPRLPTAFNYHQNQLALFRFLGDLQFEGIRANLSFDLMRLFPDLPFYPRVEFNRTIISVARWVVSEAEVAVLTNEPLSLGRLHQFRQHRGMPLVVTIGISDQQLVFDLANDEEAYFFLRSLKRKQVVIVREHLDCDRSVLVGKQRSAAQFVAVMTNNNATYQRYDTESRSLQPNLQRQFIPGSEWIYFKIYGTMESANGVLSQVIYPFIKTHAALLNQWFFIRYHDHSGTHLRLRFHTDIAQVAALTVAFTNCLADNEAKHLIKKVVQDTYEREIERYSESLMELSESCFHAQSDLYLNWLISGKLQLHESSELIIFGWVFRMAGAFYGGSQLDLFLRLQAQRLFRALAGSKQLKIELDQKHRLLNKALKIQLAEINERHRDSASDFLKDRVDRMAGASSEWPIERRMIFLADHIHMLVNRAYATRQLEHELMIYHCLAKHVRSEAARKVVSQRGTAC